MTISIKHALLLFASFLLLSFPVHANKKKKADKDTNQWRYEVEAVGTGIQGTYQIKVWTYSKDTETAIAQAKKNAIHAVIFKGFPNNGRIQGQKALSQNPNIENEQAEFFKTFFKDGGEFQKYVFLVNDGAIAAGDRIRISKKEYKIGVIVSVNIAGLRKELEVANVITSLNSGF